MGEEVKVCLCCEKEMPPVKHVPTVVSIGSYFVLSCFSPFLPSI